MHIIVGFAVVIVAIGLFAAHPIIGCVVLIIGFSIVKAITSASEVREKVEQSRADYAKYQDELEAQRLEFENWKPDNYKEWLETPAKKDYMCPGADLLCDAEDFEKTCRYCTRKRRYANRHFTPCKELVVNSDDDE